MNYDPFSDFHANSLQSRKKREDFKQFKSIVLERMQLQSALGKKFRLMQTLRRSDLSDLNHNILWSEWSHLILVENSGSPKSYSYVYYVVVNIFISHHIYGR